MSTITYHMALQIREYHPLHYRNKGNKGARPSQMAAVADFSGLKILTKHQLCPSVHAANVNKTETHSPVDAQSSGEGK